MGQCNWNIYRALKKADGWLHEWRGHRRPELLLLQAPLMIH
jgi:hypothetical protein